MQSFVINDPKITSKNKQSCFESFLFFCHIRLHCFKRNIYPFETKISDYKNIQLLYNMNKVIIGTILGVLSGFIFGLTGVSVTGFVIIFLDYLGVDSYKTIIGTLLFLNLFPLTGGSVYEFYKAKQIDYILGFTLVVTVVLGSYWGSQWAVGANALSNKQIKYISGAVNVFLAILFFISAYYDKT